MLIDRDPQGKFISSKAALEKWLPKMLHRFPGRELEEMLRVAAKWSYGESARYLSCGSLDLRNGNDLLPDGSMPWPLWAEREAKAWHRRAAILLECAKKLEETR